MEDPKTEKIRWFRASVYGALLGGVVACVVLGALGYMWVYGVSFERSWLETSDHSSVHVMDREGVVLRHMLNEDGERRTRVALSEISPWVVEATRVSEDHRFYDHHGVDPWSVLRAVVLNVRLGRVYSGASTLSMQLVRMALPGFRERSFDRKMFQAVWALRLEETLSKNDILEEYLNRAPYGNNVSGVEAASKLYFGVRASELSVAQGAFLAVLPRSPAGYNPYRFMRSAQRRQRHILGLMHKRGVLTQDAYTQALAEKIEVLPRDAPFEAPHFVESLRLRRGVWSSKGIAEVHTTVDVRLQHALEAHVEKVLRDVEPLGIRQSALVVLDNSSGEILSMVGSRDWSDVESRGRFNAALAMRPVSSMLGPFIAAESLEQGGVISNIYPDLAQGFEIAPEHVVWPRNDQGGWRGPVRLSEALALGLRVPLWSALEPLNGESMGEAWRGLDLTGVHENWRGKGTRVLGGGSKVTLLGLTSAYSALARGGEWVEPLWTRHLVTTDRTVERALVGRSERVFSNEVSAVVTGALSDDGTRLEELGSRGVLGVPYPVAWTWGVERTSGDVWAVGYTSEVTVGVWMGRFDGKPLAHVSGLDDAAPLLRAAILEAMKGRESKLLGEHNEVVSAPVCALTGHRPSADCDHVVEESFVSGSQPTETCSWHVDVPMDRRTGLRAGPSCAQSEVVWRDYVSIPKEYRRWARREGARPLSRVMSPLCPLENEHVEVDIPGMGEVFLVPSSFRTPTRSAHIEHHTRDERRDFGQ